MSAKQSAIDHALKEYPRESVGYIRSWDNTYVPLKNTAKDNDRFAVDPLDEVNAYNAGMTLFVHSHPSGLQSPSKLDMQQQAASGTPWMIIVLRPPNAHRPMPEFLEAFSFGDQLPIVPLVGRAFRHGVHDCYSLVRDWHRQERRVMLPLFPRDDEWWKTDEDLVPDSMAAWGESVSVQENQVQPGDVVLMSIGHQHGKHKINHLGVYVGNGLVLHHCAGRYSTIEPVAMYREHHILGYLRHRG